MSMEFRTLEAATLNDKFGLMAKAMSGDMVFSLSQTTAAPTVAECTAAAQVYNIAISLTTAAGELHSWYNGKVLLAVADTDGSFHATIDPTAGEHAMTNGVLEVDVTLAKGAWTANSTATLTVSDLATAGTGILGFVVADATFVAKVKA